MTRQTGRLNTTSTNCVTLGKSLSFSEPLCFCLQSRGNHAIPKSCCGDSRRVRSQALHLAQGQHSVTMTNMVLLSSSVVDSGTSRLEAGEDS